MTGTAVVVLQERRPTLPGWVPVPGLRAGGLVLAISAWQRGPTCVISALEEAELPDGTGAGPQWHVSVSRAGKRPGPNDVQAAQRAFDMRKAEEDNHHPGVARHFWLPVDPAHRVDCECKESEVLVTEPDGYRWTNPRQGAGPCRGCELSRLVGQPCPLHPQDSPPAALVRLP